MHVYLLTNTVNGKMYVGQSNMEPLKRLSRHFYAAKNPTLRVRQLITKAIYKYGEGAFTHSVLEECVDQKALDERESYWIEKLQSMHPLGYNFRGGGNGGAHTEEVKRKMSLAKIGKPLSPEHVENMSAALRGRKLSEEAKAKMSASHKERVAAGLCKLGGHGHTSFEDRSRCQKVRFSKKSERDAMSRAVKEGNLTFAKLTMEIVLAAREEYAKGGVTYSEIARRHGVNQSTMRDAIVGISWN